MKKDIDFNIMRENGFYNRFFKERIDDKKEMDKVGWKRVEECPVCSEKNSKNTIKYKTSFGNYIECGVCHCIYIDSVPSRQNAGQFSALSYQDIESSPDEQKRKYRINRFGRERVEIIRKHSKVPLSKLSLLDVGCNTGFFIESAKPHFKEVFGLEVEKSLSEYAEKKTGCIVYTGDISILKRKFDVITLFDLIEHLENPFQFLQNCSDLLKENGMLLIFTPNYASFGFSVLGNDCSHIRPGHLVLFRNSTCKYVFEKLKMDLIYYETAGMDIFDIIAYERDIKNIDFSNNEELRFANKNQDMINKLGYANSLRFILRKNKVM